MGLTDLESTQLQAVCVYRVARHHEGPLFKDFTLGPELSPGVLAE